MFLGLKAPKKMRSALAPSHRNLSQDWRSLLRRPERASSCHNPAVLNVLAVTFPFFALVLCGFVAARQGLLPLQAIPGLNSFVLFFALPCLLYRFGATTPIAQLLNGTLAAVYLVCALLMVAFVVAITLRAPPSGRIGWNDAAFGALVGAFPNTGFMGVPLLVALLGAQAAGPVIVTILVDMVVTSSLCIALSRLDRPLPSAGHVHVNAASHHLQGHAAATALKNALKGVLTNPMPWSILLGAAVSGLQWEFPKPVVQTVGLLADAASPVALFTIGAVLARSQLLARQDAAHAVPWQDYVPVALVKLLLHPVLVLVLGSLAIRAGLPLERFSLTVLVLLAALPSASNVSLLAERFGADNGRIARIILVSTAVSFFTFSGAVALLA